MISPQEFYTTKKQALAAELALLLIKKSRVGWARFIVMILFIASIYLAVNNNIIFLAATIILLIVFARLVYADINNNNTISHCKYLIEVNDEELVALSGNYLHFADGAVHAPHDHLYANDIDLFGRASLFQYINRTTSEMGGTVLADWLLHPANEENIHRRQTAIKELVIITEWRQKLQALGKAKKIVNDTKLRLHSWMQERGMFLTNKFWRILQLGVPIIMLSVLVLNIFGFVSNPVRNYFLLASAILAYYIAQKVGSILAQVSKMSDELSVLSGSILLIEKTQFQSPLLKQLHKIYEIEKGFASGELKKLKNILARLDYRLNPVVFIPLAVLLQWDLQQVIALEKWKRRNQQNIVAWFDALGTLEALSSFSTLHFNHPEWSFPTIIA